MSISPEVARQYLKAMGIESWEPRGSEVPEPQSPSHAPVATNWQGAIQYNNDSFVSHLAEAMVVESNSLAGQVLVVLESPALQPEGQTLLASMLNAIQIDLAQQALVTVQATGSESVKSIAERVKPQIILVMAQFQNDLSELAALRSAIHRASWTSAPIAVTLHPALLLSQPDLKRPAWEDLKRVKSVLDG